jgi:hypothetical protein
VPSARGDVDCTRFTHKNHLYLFGLPFDATRERALARTVTFENQTFTPGITTRTELRNLLIGLGYQYDFIRRRRGHLGVAIQANILNTPPPRYPPRPRS